jgi:HK97 gp10 family phage protein
MAGSEATGFQGLEELKTNLEKLHNKLAGDSMRQALMAAAGVFKSAIEAATPIGESSYTYKYGNKTVRIKHKPGTAKANVIIYQRRAWGELSVGQGETSLLVGHEKKHAYYMYWWEYGTKKSPAHGTIRNAFDSANASAYEAATAVLTAAVGGA